MLFRFRKEKQNGQEFLVLDAKEKTNTCIYISTWKDGLRAYRDINSELILEDEDIMLNIITIATTIAHENNDDEALALKWWLTSFPPHIIDSIPPFFDKEFYILQLFKKNIKYYDLFLKNQGLFIYLIEKSRKTSCAFSRMLSY